MMIVEKILWIESSRKYSGENNDFIFNLYNYIDNNGRKVTVQLLHAYIGLFDTDYHFNTAQIKILADLGVSSNQISNGQYLILGVINPSLVNDRYSNEMVYHGPIYNISSIPQQYINIRLTNWENVNLVDSNGDIPGSVILCLKFTYEI